MQDAQGGVGSSAREFQPLLTDPASLINLCSDLGQLNALRAYLESFDT
jgi:hypothetical protein